MGIYCTVKIHFHVITNEESKDFVDQIMEKMGSTSNCNYDYEMLYFDQMIEYTRQNICPETAKSEEYCDLLIGRVTPLLFPWLFPSLSYILYVDKHIIFHDDVGKLYDEFLNMDEDEAIGMVQEQTLKYLRAFGSYHVKSPTTKLGRPPGKGSPGFNPDLGEILNLIAAEKPQMFHKLSCEWNKSANTGHDPLSSQFLDCLPENQNKKEVKATNKNPNHRR